MNVLALAIACYRWLHCKAEPAALQAPTLAEEGTACCYICQLSDTPGRFLPEKAAALGVPKGPLFGRLKGGQAVQLPNGKEVQPTDVSPTRAMRLAESLGGMLATYDSWAVRFWIGCRNIHGKHALLQCIQMTSMHR